MANPNGEGEYLEVVAEDLGAQRSLETQLRRARKWEDAARVTSGIAADLTHLVDAIKEAADRLANESAHDETARHHADAIGQAVARASALSRQLVAFGRKEARDPKTFDLNETVRGLERVVRRLIDEHIDIALALAPDAGAVEVSEPALEEAVVHLGVAAASALPAGGRIELATRACDVEATDDNGPDGLKAGHYGLISITASGWGLDAEIQRDDVTKGVTSARRSIGRVGGSVSAIAVAGTSLTFRIYVPAVQGTEEFESEEYTADVDATSSSIEATPGN
jgi:signal transduction histidine kinase